MKLYDFIFFGFFMVKKASRTSSAVILIALYSFATIALPKHHFDLYYQNEQITQRTVCFANMSSQLLHHFGQSETSVNYGNETCTEGYKSAPTWSNAFRGITERIWQSHFSQYLKYSRKILSLQPATDFFFSFYDFW